MAISKIHAITKTVGKSIDYITDINKTLLADGTRLVSSFGCATETAAIEFNLTSNLAKRVKGDYTKTGGAENKAYHIIQSFDIADKDKLSAKEMHELGKQFAEQFLGGKYEYVIATHIDKKHIHNHIIFNSTSFVDYKKFRSQPYKTVAKIREISDMVCEENGLSVLPAKVGIGKSYKEWLISKEGKLTWKDTIKNKIDEVVPRVHSFAEFIVEINKSGIEVKEGKHIAFRCAGTEQERFIRGKRIGESYTKEEIIKRLGVEISSEQTVFKTTEVVIDKSYINKILTDGFIINVPGKDYLLYLNGATAAQLNEDNITANLKESEYTIFNQNMTPAGKVAVEEVLSSFGAEPIENTELKTNDKGEIPISEYLRLRRKSQKAELHKVADALAHARAERVIYPSDFALRIKELKDQAYDTRHTLIDLDNTVAELEEIGKLLVSYQKYLPLKGKYEEVKNTKFQKRKFETKYNLELASLDYVEQALQEKGIDTVAVSVNDIVEEIKSHKKVIKFWEQQEDEITVRIDKLNEAQSTIKDFIRGDDELQQRADFILRREKDNVEL